MLVFGWIILGALVFNSMNHKDARQICVTGMHKLTLLEQRILDDTVNFVINASTVFRVDKDGKRQVAGFLPLPREPPEEFAELINRTHQEYEQVRTRGMVSVAVHEQFLSSC